MCHSWWRTDLQRRAWPWRESSPSSPGPLASGGTGSTTALTSVSTLSSLLTQMASRWTKISLTEILFMFWPGWSSQQIRGEEGEVGGAPEDHEGGGGHDHWDLQTVQGDLGVLSSDDHHCVEGAGGREERPDQVPAAPVSGGDRLHCPGAHAAHIPDSYRALVLLRNYLHRYQIIRKVLKSFQITFKVTLAKYNFDQRRESSFWHFVHK